ncbi:unnamed protein product [Clavelina lepadiformis]|uniref:Macrophage migration inhibitory factor n=1 Tax=Clavelina lepadiformis TaxID=159417 RepID=A0ABP0GVT7_CLALP
MGIPQLSKHQQQSRSNHGSGVNVNRKRQLCFPSTWAGVCIFNRSGGPGVASSKPAKESKNHDSDHLCSTVTQLHRFKMPELVIKTNVKKESIKSTILQDLTKILVEALQKPEKYISVVVIPDLWMSFGGTEEPCATCCLTSVNQFHDAEANRNYAKCVLNYLYDALGVSQERAYLEFNRSTRETMGYKADTFYGLLGPSS